MHELRRFVVIFAMCLCYVYTKNNAIEPLLHERPQCFRPPTILEAVFMFPILS